MKFFGSATPVRSAIPVRGRGGVTNTEPACTAVRGILPSVTPVRAGGVTNTELACTVVRGVLPSATPISERRG